MAHPQEGRVREGAAMFLRSWAAIIAFLAFLVIFVLGGTKSCGVARVFLSLRIQMACRSGFDDFDPVLSFLRLEI